MARKCFQPMKKTKVYYEESSPLYLGRCVGSWTGITESSIFPVIHVTEHDCHIFLHLYYVEFYPVMKRPTFSFVLHFDFLACPRKTVAESDGSY